MKKRKAGRFVALFLVCLLLLGLVPTDVQRPLYNEGAVSAAGQAFSDGDTAPVQDPVNLVPVQSGTVTADENGGSTEIVPAEAKSGGTENNAGFTDTEKSQPEDSGSLEQNQNHAQTTGEGETPEENPTPEIPEGTPEGDGADQETPDDTFTDGGAGDETPEEKPDKTAPEASDGSLGNTAFYFADKSENSSVSGVWAVFDGGADEAAEVQLQMGEDGYYAGTIPAGDYSRLTFQIADADGVRTAITPSYRYYEGQSALENTQMVLFQKDVLDTYYYCPESNSYWAVRENMPGATLTPAPSASPTPTPEAEENRITEPSDGSWAGQEMHFVNLYWEDQDMGDVYALFQGGEAEDQAILMSRGNRGKYTVTVPEGDHSRVSFAKLIGAEEAPEDQGASDGQDEFGDQGAAEADFLNTSTAENNLYGNNDGTLSVNGNVYAVLGNSFQYYNEASAASNCTPVAYCPDSFDTYYYDAEVPARSYWGADALYEPPIADHTSSSSKPMRAPMAGAEDTDFAGQTLYFVDMTEDEANSVKRVTMQFYDQGHTGETPASEMIMYEGRTNIFSAPIPEGGYQEVTFKLEYVNGTTYKLTRHYNIYTENTGTTGNENEENFKFVQGEMDTFFYNNHPENTDGDSVDSYWGPHPSVTDRSLDAQYLYIDTEDVNGDRIIMNPTSMTINYGKGDEKVTLTTRDKNVRAFQFPLNSGATEQTVITLKGKTGYLDENGELISSAELDSTTQPETEIVFRFYYPYNSNKKMIITDNIRDIRPVFGEFVLDDAESIYVIYDNTSTGFTEIQYRVKGENEDWTEWADLTKTDPESWKENKNEAIVANLWGAEVNSGYQYVQFRGKKSNDYRWRSTESTEDGSLALIPATEYSYPCFYGVSTETNGSADKENITGRWLSALDVRNFGDDTVDIPTEGKFEKEQNTYYGTSTFYDYYIDSQMIGTKLSENTAINAANMLNRELSKYYKENDKSGTLEPFYMNAQNNNDSRYDLKLYKYDDKINTWYENQRKYITSGLVDKELVNGQLMTDGIQVPLFNKEFLRGDNTTGANFAQIYNNVYFPFKKGTSGYWEFDSSQPDQTLRMKYDVNNGYYLDRTGKGITRPDFSDQYSFFPFNDSGDEENKRHINYLFATKFEIPFTLPEGNVVVMEEGGEEEDVTFTFSGDDDTWIFIDGKLVLDIGGIHDRLEGTINFQTGKATLTNAEGDKSGNFEKTTPFTLDTSIQEHTLTMFYMERGQGDSNLKVRFNFPKQNTLNVQNEIDTSAADSLFSDALSNIGSFAYQIANKVTSGTSVDVQDSAGYVDLGTALTFNSIDASTDIEGENGSFNSSHTDSTGETRNGVLEIRQKKSLNGESADAEIDSQLVKVNGSIDIQGQAYLRFWACNDSDSADNAGESLYVELRDASGNRLGGWANRTAYDGSSNSLGSNEWSLVRVAINELKYKGGTTSFDYGKVTSIAFATRETTPMYIDDLAFYKAVEEKPSHKFSVEQDEISDYGSVQEGEYTLSNVDGAWYGHFAEGMSRSTYRMVEDGFFAVGDNERAEFVDKFRTGAYLQITQRDVSSKVFDTTWSIWDGAEKKKVPQNDLLKSRTKIYTVKNDGTRENGEYPLENQVTTDGDPRPDDGRIALDSEGNEVAKPVSTNNRGGSFVFRSYDKPDDSEINPIHLTAKFKNVLRTGSITIKKKVTGDAAAAAGSTYRFLITFYDVAGMNLEDAPLPKEIMVRIGSDGTGSATFSGIPAGTSYKIQEMKQPTTVLETITLGPEAEVNPHEQVAVTNATTGKFPVATGIAYASDQEFTFKNRVESKTMIIEKHWEDQSAPENSRPDKIGIQLRRRKGESEDWENVTTKFYNGETGGEQGQEYIVLSTQQAITENKDVWRVETKVLDATDENGVLYDYEIKEVQIEGVEGWNLKNYKTEYIQGDPETGAYIVINRPNAITVRKEWKDEDDQSRPIEVEVQLQRRIKDSGKEYKDVGNPIILSTHGTPAWEYVFPAMERMDENQKEYEYAIKETKLIYATVPEGQSDRVIEVKNNQANGYTVKCSSNEDNTVLTVTNSKGKGQVILEKRDLSTKKLLAGAKFKLERLRPSDITLEESEAEFEYGKYNSNWTVDKNYNEVEKITDENGKIDWDFLPFGFYRVTEIQAPDGYILSDQPFDFKIDQTVLDQVKKEKNETYLMLEFTNQATIDLPTSGAAGTFMFTLAGLILIGSAMLLYKLHLQKIRKRVRARADVKKMKERNSR